MRPRPGRLLTPGSHLHASRGGGGTWREREGGGAAQVRSGTRGRAGHPARGPARVRAPQTQPPAAASFSPHLSRPVSARWSCYCWSPGCWSPPGQVSVRRGSRCCRCTRGGCSCRGPPWGSRGCGRDPRASGRGRSRCRSRCDGGRDRAQAR